MTRFLDALRRVPFPAWLTATIVLAWVVFGGIMWAKSTRADDASAGGSSAAVAPTVTPSSSPPTETAAAASCTASAIVTNEWDGGFQIDVTVTAHSVALSDWTVSLDLGSATIDGTWNSTLAGGATDNVTASNLDYNGTVSAGASTVFGFTAAGQAPASLAPTCTSATVAGTPSIAATPGSPPPAHVSASTVKSPLHDDWLSTKGNRIVDAKGHPVWLTGANWFGFNTQERVFHGLSTAHMGTMMDAIASRGINVMRVPISTELLLEWRDGRAAIPTGLNYAVNPELAGKNSLEVFDAFLAQSKDRGVKVILDVHSAKADNSGHIAPMWFAGNITAQDFSDAWAWVAERYSNDDTIIGFDLKNEPHGQPSENPRAKWDGSTDATNWRDTAERVATRIQAVNPYALILVEGVEVTPKAGKTDASTLSSDYDYMWWGGNLRGAAKYPVRLEVANKLVYSPHDYGPLVYEQPWFKTSFTASSLRADVWGPNWLYLHDAGTAPLLIGEWGGRLGQDPRQDAWMTSLRDLIVAEHLAHTFWCINPNSGDTGGLLLDDWTSWDESKYALLKPALWQDRHGKFVSLDHATPLPGGVSVTEYYTSGNAAPLG